MSQKKARQARQEARANGTYVPKPAKIPTGTHESKGDKSKRRRTIREMMRQMLEGDLDRDAQIEESMAKHPAGKGKVKADA